MKSSTGLLSSIFHARQEPCNGDGVGNFCLSNGGAFCPIFAVPYLLPLIFVLYSSLFPGWLVLVLQHRGLCLGTRHVVTH